MIISSYHLQCLLNLDSNFNPETAFNTIGVELENTANISCKYSTFIIAEVTSCIPHPDSERLNLCEVFDGNETLKIVCGASNVRSNTKIILAREGSVIPSNGLIIKKSVIRGQESNGMICSCDELELHPLVIASHDYDGISIVSDHLKAGTPLIEAFPHLNDVLYDISITPNRGDLLSHYGIARELVSFEFGLWKKDVLAGTSKATLSPSIECSKSVEITSSACLEYSICQIELDNLPSEYPLIADLLWKSGSNLQHGFMVDLTNYAMFFFGRPTHAFDANSTGSKLVIRDSDDYFEDLKQNVHKLENDCVISSENGEILSLGGIMGGKSSSVKPDSLKFILESAAFNNDSVRQTSTRTVKSESSYRFERYVDTANTSTTLEQMLHIMITLGVNFTYSEIKTVQNTSSNINNEPCDIRFSLSEASSFLNIDLTKEAINFLERSHFSIRNISDTELLVTPPKHRGDILIKEDIFEEIAKFYGFEKVPEVPLPRYTKPATNNIDPKHVLKNLGLKEVISFPFTSHNFANSVTLVNPINAENSYMRTAIIYDIITRIRDYKNLGYHSHCLFEIGNVYHQSSKITEEERICVALTGFKYEHSYNTTSAKYNIFDAKEILQNIIPEVEFDTYNKFLETPELLHSKLSYSVKVNGNEIGVLASTNTFYTNQRFGLEDEVLFFEMKKSALSIPSPKPYSKNLLQPISREFSILVTKNIQYSDIENIIRNNCNILSEVKLTDIYNDERFGDKISYSFNIILQPNENISGDDIDGANGIVMSITNNLNSKIGAVLRDGIAAT